MDKKVVITGIGVISPNAIGRDNFKKALREGKSGIKDITLFDASGLGSVSAGEVKDFNAEEFLGHKGLRNLNRTTRLCLSAARLALDDARLKYPVGESQSYNYGVSIGTATGSMHSIMDFDREVLLEGPHSPNPAHFPNTVMNVAAGCISIWFNIKGFNSTVTSALCSSMDAVIYAVNMIKNYNYNVVIAGGVEELCLETFLGFYKTGILSGSRPKSREFVSCPYDKRRNGAILSEGSCVLILEDFMHAKKRNAKIYAVIEGYGFSFDTYNKCLCNPKAEGACLAIKKALTDAKVKEDNIDCIFGSANSTVDCDVMEARAIREVFKKSADDIYVTSIKSMIGETFSAGAAFNIGASAIAIDDSFLPPTINYAIPDERCDLNIVRNKYVDRKVNNVLVNSFSSTGANSALVLLKIR